MTNNVLQPRLSCSDGSIHTCAALEEFQNTIIVGKFRFVFEESSDRAEVNAIVFETLSKYYPSTPKHKKASVNKLLRFRKASSS